MSKELPFSVKKKKEIKEKIFKKNFANALTSGGEFSALRQSFNKYKDLKHDARDNDYHLLDDNVCKAFLDLLNTIYISSKEEAKFFANFVKDKDKEMGKIARETDQSLGTVMKVFSSLYDMADGLKNAAFGERYLNDVYNPIKKFLGEIKTRYNKIFDDKIKSAKSVKEADEKKKRIKKDVEAFVGYLFSNCKSLQGKVSGYITYRMGQIDSLNRKYGLDPDFLLDEELVFFRVLYSIAGVRCPKETPYASYSDGATSSDNGLLYTLVKNTSEYVEKVLMPKDDKDDEF